VQELHLKGEGDDNENNDGLNKNGVDGGEDQEEENRRNEEEEEWRHRKTEISEFVKVRPSLSHGG
jgi:hypothetical protein